MLLAATHAPHTRCTLCCLCSLLRLLGSRWGTMLAIGFRANGWNMPLAFVDMPRQRREAILQDWSHSKQAKMRKARAGQEERERGRERKGAGAGARGKGGQGQWLALHQKADS